MNRAVKVVVSLPDDLLASADEAARVFGMSRSRLFREALAVYLQERGSTAVKRYLKAYQQLGPTVDHGLGDAVGSELLLDGARAVTGAHRPAGSACRHDPSRPRAPRSDSGHQDGW